MGDLDILVNNAGAAWGAPAEDHPIEATGRKLRALFAWKQQDADYTDGSAAR